jgi:hypothetical protein
MKITKILPKSFAIGWQEYDLNKVESLLEYHRTIVQNLEYRLAKGQEELQRLRRKNND